MNSSKNTRLVIFFLLFLSLISLSFAYPQFSFTQTSIPTGEITLSGEVSSGVDIDLSVNGVFIGTDNVIGDTVTVELGSSAGGLIENEQVAVGAVLSFVNVHSSKTYKIRIETINNQGQTVILFSETLAPGGVADFTYNRVETLNYVQEEESSDIIKTIRVHDDNMFPFSFSVNQNKFSGGNNEIEFKLRYTNSNGIEQVQTKPYTINYDKYPNNIVVPSYDENIKTKSTTISGQVSMPSAPLYYLLNIEGELQSGAALNSQNKITVNSDATFTAQISNLREGENTIRLISTDANNENIFNGEERIIVKVDTVPPRVSLIDASFTPSGSNTPVEYDEIPDDGLFINGPQLTLTYSTDASELEYTLNERDPEDLLITRFDGLDNLAEVENIEVDSDSRNLDVTIKIQPNSQSLPIRVEVNYDDRSTITKEIQNGEITFSLRLEEDARDFDVKFINGQGTVTDHTLEIGSAAYESYADAITGISQVDENNIGEITVTLQDGKNNFLLVAKDAAGNEHKESHAIYFSNQDPRIERNTLEPESGSEVHFFLQKIEGKTNLPFVSIKAFTIPGGSKDSDGNTVTCNSYENNFIRELGDIRNDRERGSQTDVEDIQINLGLPAVFSEETVTSGEDGSFDLRIGLQEESFDYSDLRENQRAEENQRNPEVTRVRSQNEVCFFLSDKFGNTNMESMSLTLDAGNTLWRPGEITTTPNSLYASEIEQTGDVRSGSGLARVGLIARFSYLGEGNIERIERFRVSEDRAASDQNVNINIPASEVYYVLDKDTGEMVVYFPVEVSPLGIDALEYPDEIELKFRATVEYKVDSVEIPIDTQNPIFFQTVVNVESPLDRTKWLTPSMIEDSLGFLNDSIKFTEKAIDWTGAASVVGVGVCTVAKLYYTAQMGLTNDPEKKKEYERKIYMACDRVACSASPDVCGSGTISATSQGILPLQNADKFDTSTGKGFESENFNTKDLQTQGRIIQNGEDDGRVMARFDNLGTTGTCVYGTDSDGKPIYGVKVTGDVTRFEEAGGLWYSAEKKTIEAIHDRCVKVENIEGKNYLNLNQASGACFSTGSPNFDETRCNFFGADKEGVPGWDSSDNLIESIRCGCITDTHSHLKTMLRVQEGIQKCLEQAKIGEVKGAYCEKLVGMAVCDVATNVMFKTLGQGVNTRTNGDGIEPHSTTGLAQALKAYKEEERSIDNRYRGTLLSKTGLSTDQIANKACIGALTGDWSVIQENILNAVEQNEVDPIFGPALATSRLSGYNPFNGEVSVQYRFAYSAVSGGQHINTKVTFICDSSQLYGNYCPDDGRKTSEELGSRIPVRTLTVGPDQAKQDTVVINDEGGRFWYNVIRLEHEYTLDGKKETQVQEELIQHKGELFESCYFTGGVLGAGAGISCGTLFDDNALISSFTIERDSHLVPDVTNPTYYPGNPIYLSLHYNALVQGSQNAQTGFDVAYYAACNSPGEKKSLHRGVHEVSKSGVGVETFKLFESPLETSVTTIPLELGKAEQETETLVYSLLVPELENPYSSYEYVGFKITNGAGVTSSNFIIQESELVVSQGTFIPQGLTVNLNSENPSTYIQVNNNIDKIKPKETLRIKLNKVVENLDITLVVGDSKETAKPVGRFISGTRVSEYVGGFERIIPGKCDLLVKLVPRGQGETALRQVEKDYTKLEQFNFIDDESLETSSNLGSSSGFKKFEFTVADKTTEGNTKASFDFITPSEGQSICVDKNTDRLNLEYIFLPSNPSTSEKFEVSYEIIAQQYVGDFGSSPGTELKSITGEIKMISPTGDNKFLEGFYNLLGIAFDRAGTSTTTVPNENVDMKVVYTVNKLKSKGEVEKAITSGIRNFKVSLTGENCRDLNGAGRSSKSSGSNSQTTTMDANDDTSEIPVIN